MVRFIIAALLMLSSSAVAEECKQEDAIYKDGAGNELVFFKSELGASEPFRVLLKSPDIEERWGILGWSNGAFVVPYLEIADSKSDLYSEAITAKSMSDYIDVPSVGEPAAKSFETPGMTSALGAGNVFVFDRCKD